MRSLNPDAPNALKLGESHFQRITSTLVLLDQRLDEMERWASWPLPSGPLYLWRRDLDRLVLARIGLEAGKAKEECGAAPGGESGKDGVGGP